MAFDPYILGTILVILIASSVIFSILVRRETRNQRQIRLDDWSERNGFKSMQAEFGMPRPLDRFHPLGLVLVEGVFDYANKIIHARSRDSAGATVNWHLAIRQLATHSPVIGLRPVDCVRSIIDLLDLPVSDRQPNHHRFTVVGDDLIATRQLADGSSIALLPADLSLLRIDAFLIIDFSGRPYDPIELGRIESLMDQLASIA